MFDGTIENTFALCELTELTNRLHCNSQYETSDGASSDGPLARKNLKQKPELKFI